MPDPAPRAAVQMPECPDCGIAAGSPCLDPDGRPGAPHPARLRVVLQSPKRRWTLFVCPACGEQVRPHDEHDAFCSACESYCNSDAIEVVPVSDRQELIERVERVLSSADFHVPNAERAKRIVAALLDREDYDSATKKGDGDVGSGGKR